DHSHADDDVDDDDDMTNHNNRDNNEKKPNNTDSTNVIKDDGALAKLSTTSTKSDKWKKLTVLFLIINIGFPLYLAYNTPTSMVKLLDTLYDMDAEQFSRLYSVYALPNLIMVFLGGILVDLFGANKCSIIFQSILFSSAILAALSSLNTSYSMLLFSRVLLGIGGETLLVCVSTFIAQWFSSNEMPFVMGIESTWVQFASLLAFGALPSLREATSIPFTLWFVAFVALTALVLNIVFVVFQSKLRYNNDEQNNYNNLESKVEELGIDDDTLPETDPDAFNIQQMEVIQLKDDDVDENAPIDVSSMSSLQRVKHELWKAVSLIKDIPQKMWIHAVICFFGYSAFYGLDIIATDMIIEKYGYTDARAAMVMASETLCTGLMGPLFGYAIKRTEMRATIVGIGIIIMGVGIIILTLTTSTPFPWYVVIMSGFGYGMMNNGLMSSVPLIVEERIIGTSYGLVGTSYNVGIVLFPLILGVCRKTFGNYNFAMWILVLSSILALVFLLWLKMLDLKQTDNSKRLDKKR
ncbi:hypothetical protein SAMD00019534_015280, partial [Acytostelium subglobosum LB1]|uniref:hypothetical protein n=1 Tax=Acytostelium subglobosum LB1 TaxID=1410327 RepID=UPI0006451AE6